VVDSQRNNLNISYFLKASKNFYFIALVSFTISLLINEFYYIKFSRIGLIITDSVSVFAIYTALIFYLKKAISLKFSSAIYAYITLINLAISAWYYYTHHIYFTGNFLFSTFIFLINLIVAGFCIGRKHAFIAAALYTVSFGPLIFVSHDDYLNQNAFTILFLIIAFSFAVSGFLHVLEKTHQEELALREEIFKKDKTLAQEHNKWLTFELECKQKEIVAKTMFLLEYAENNNAFIKGLNNLKEKLNRPEQMLLNEIIQTHRMDHQEKYWKEFETSFLEIHPDFYKNLYKICPDISPSELKLAALVHLGLSSKQIGSLNSNTPESVDVARSRLRNKLNMPTDANLKTFLLNM
jgi:hypothetical protein